MSRRRPLTLLLILVLATAVILTTSMLLQNRPEAQLVDSDAISNFDLDQHYGRIDDIPAEARSLEGHKIKIQGHMWAPSSTQDSTLSFFQLVKLHYPYDGHHVPLAQDFINCIPTPNARVTYFADPVTVYGTWHVAIKKSPDGVIKSVFQIDVDRVEPLPPAIRNALVSAAFSFQIISLNLRPRSGDEI